MTWMLKCSHRLSQAALIHTLRSLMGKLDGIQNQINDNIEVDKEDE